MKFELQLKKKEESVVFDNLEFYEFFYSDESDVIDAKFKAKDKKQLSMIMSFYQKFFMRSGGTMAKITREGGAAFEGIVFIYPTKGKQAKIHIDVKTN